jgi:hypothetical protein
MPTSRIDILIYSQQCKREIRYSSEKLNKKRSCILKKTAVSCRFSCNMQKITRPENIRKRIHKGEMEGRISYWLDPKVYEEFRDNWKEIDDWF